MKKLAALIVSLGLAVATFLALPPDVQSAITTSIIPNRAFSGQVLAPDGTAAAPSYSYANQNTTGPWRRTSGVLTYSVAGSDQWEMQGGSFLLGSNTALAWGNASTISTSGAIDTYLYRDAANTLAQRNGVNAQTMRVYNTYTDAANFSRSEMLWSGTEFVIQSNAAGTGTLGNMSFGPAGSASVFLQTAGTHRWQVSGVGHFLAAVDASYDIGTAGANRPRTLYLSNKINYGSFAFANITTILTANGDVAYCFDCTIANPCAGGGTGALAKRINAVNVCN